MFLKQMMIENFRCYKDTQIFDFSLDGKITLFRGPSGGGKTTLIHFINWMFYNEMPKNNKGEIDTEQPLYNSIKYEETNFGSTFKLSGMILFVHNETEYKLHKEIIYKKDYSSSMQQSYDCRLLYKFKNGNWIQFNGNIDEKICEIVPKALSKYFFFSGEKNVVEENSTDLEDAIFNMFGISKYKSALDHLGDKTTPNTVIRNYHNKKTEKPSNVNNSAQYYLNELTKYQRAFDIVTEEARKESGKLEYINKRIETLTNEIASFPRVEDETKKLEQNLKLVKEYEKHIVNYKISIGNMLYQSVPYLLLSDKINLTKNILSESAKDEKTFKGLSKETLKDILKQGICLCGRNIDHDAEKCINDIINSMPPKSYNYIYNQFVRDSKVLSNQSQNMYDKINSLLAEISKYKQEINECEEDNRKIINSLKKSPKEELKKKAQELEDLRKEALNKGIFINERKNKSIAYKKQIDNLNKLYHDAYEYEMKKDDYNDKISILEMTKERIEKLKKIRIAKTKIDLNKYMIEIYNKISTRVEDFTEKEFLTDKFTLRTDYLSGGQELIDVYSYVLGMIKALRSTNDEENLEEFPIVVDAPYSKLDDLQLERIVNVFPEIAGQVIMFTNDPDRLVRLGVAEKFGNVWTITTNDKQKLSKITKGEL